MLSRRVCLLQTTDHVERTCIGRDTGSSELNIAADRMLAESCKLRAGKSYWKKSCAVKRAHHGLAESKEQITS